MIDITSIEEALELPTMWIAAFVTGFLGKNLPLK